MSFSIFAYAVEFTALKTGAGRSIFENAGYKILSIPEFIKSIVLYISPVDNHLWFSYVMLLVIIISYALRNVTLRNLTMLAGVFYILTWPISFPEIIWKTMRYLFLFQIGRLFFEIKVEKIIHKKAFISLTIFAFSFTAYMLLRAYKIYIPQSIAQPIAEMSGVLFIIGLVNKFNTGGRSWKQLEKLGSKTYPIYLMHQPFLVPGLGALFGKMGCPIPIILLLSTVIGIAIPVVIDHRIIEKLGVLRFLILGGNIEK